MSTHSVNKIMLDTNGEEVYLPVYVLLENDYRCGLQILLYCWAVTQTKIIHLLT